MQENDLYMIFCSSVLLAAGLYVYFGLGKAPSHEEQLRIIENERASSK